MKKPKKIKVIFAAQDPGGFNTILPVIKKLKKNSGFLLKIILANQSKDMAKNQRINYRDGNYLTEKTIARFFKKESPDLIFTATSVGYSLEKKIVKLAKRQKIKTVAIIDIWSNYKLRFSDPGTKNLTYLPDYILVIDRLMKKEMISQGFDSKKLIITGNPFFDTFPILTSSSRKEKVISFFSQPFSESCKKDKNYLDYSNEIQVFRDIVRALEKFQLKIPLKIKFHPRDTKLNKLDKIIKGSKLNISIEKKLSAENLIKKSKLIIGINSMVLFQAAMMDKPVLSYQPNLKKPDPLISNRLGLSWAVYKKKNLYPALKKLLSIRGKKQNRELIKRYTQNKSTQKVIDFIINLLKNDS